MFGWLKPLLGMGGAKSAGNSNPGRAQVLRLKARYDSAVASDKHWNNVDGLSAKSANSVEVRRNLRERSRYETANNCHARGLTLTLANDLVGTGPRLQIGFDDDAVNSQIEVAWNAWANEIGLAEKLHTFALAKVVDGESFALLATNKSLFNSVKLDLMLVEADQVATPYGVMFNPFNPNWVDGIEFDDFGNPTVYHVLKFHPGDPFVLNWEYDKVPARNVLHWFRVDRPQQKRGIPEITPALPLFAQLRRYTLAVIEAAETAADFAAIIHTETSPDNDNLPDGQSGNAIDAFDSTEIDRGMMVTLPAGYKMSQFTPTQPTASHDQFQKTILKEIFHCLNMPYAVGSGDYADDSYSSGRLGKQTYMRTIKVQRHHLTYQILDRIWAAWLDSAVNVPGLLPPIGSYVGSEIPHQWHFRDDPFVDPAKDAQADALELENLTTTLAEKCAERGLDYREVITQLGKEKKLKIKAGVYIDPTPVQGGGGGGGAKQSGDGQGGTAQGGDTLPSNKEAVPA